MSNTHYEIERKYLIEMPDTRKLDQDPAAEKIQISQTYLLCDAEKGNRRIRKWTEKGQTSYIYTSKIKLSDLKRIEEEYPISEEDYQKLLLEKDPSSITLEKVRYRIYENKLCFELDVFPFWKKQAYLEVELSQEEEEFELPSFVRVIRELSSDPAYSNYALAHEIPAEE